jgi:hypothetical protein
MTLAQRARDVAAGRGKGLVGVMEFCREEAVEGGAADAELAGGAQLVAAVEFEDELDVAVNGGVEGEVGGGRGIGGPRAGLSGAGGLVMGLVESEVAGAEDAGAGVEDGGFETEASSRTLPGQVCCSRRGRVPGARTAVGCW